MNRKVHVRFGGGQGEKCLTQQWRKLARCLPYAEYALLLGAIGAVAAAVIARFRNELRASFDFAIRQLAAARGG